MRSHVLARATPPRRWRPALAALLLTFMGGAAFAVWVQSARPPRAIAPEATPPAERSRGTEPGRAPMPRLVPQRHLLPAEPARELELLRRIPAPLLEAMRADRLDDAGLTIHNRQGFSCSGNQRFALEAMPVGAALGRPELVARGWSAIDSTFRYQADDGSFLDGALCTSYWLSHLGHALLVLSDSDEGPASAERVRALLPRIARAARWLAAPEQRETLDETARDFPSRLLYHATAFGLTGRLLGDGALEALGADYAEQALAHQRPDGTFAMQPPLDALYQGSVLWKLAWYALRFPDPRFDEALRRGGRWLLARVEPDGTLDLSDTAKVPMGRGEQRRTANLQEAAWALLYYGARFSDGEALSSTDRLLARNRARLVPADGPAPRGGDASAFRAEAARAPAQR